MLDVKRFHTSWNMDFRERGGGQLTGDIDAVQDAILIENDKDWLGLRLRIYHRPVQDNGICRATIRRTVRFARRFYGTTQFMGRRKLSIDQEGAPRTADASLFRAGMHSL